MNDYSINYLKSGSDTQKYIEKETEIEAGRKTYLVTIILSFQF